MTRYDVVICGSFRFAGRIHELAAELRAKGLRVGIPIGRREDYDGNPRAAELKWARMKRFLRKVDRADSILVFNEEDYIGLNTAIEIGYALARGKRIAFVNESDHLEVRAIAKRNNGGKTSIRQER